MAAKQAQNPVGNLAIADMAMFCEARPMETIVSRVNRCSAVVRVRRIRMLVLRMHYPVHQRLALRQAQRPRQKQCANPPAPCQRLHCHGVCAIASYGTLTASVTR